jgi:hypothetical protein
MRYIVTVIAALTLSTACYAQDGKLSLYGLGANSCGQYLAAVHGHPPGKARALNRPEGRYSDDHFRYMAWLDGFFSATNILVDERNQLKVDAAAIDVWIRKWCEQNPTQPLVEAASAFASASLSNDAHTSLPRPRRD